MARTILRVGAAAWVLAGAAGLALSVFGTEWLLALLPPLAIGADALARAVGTFALALVILGLLHLLALAGLRSTAWGASAGILLASFVGAALLTLFAAGVTSAVAQPESAPGLLGGALAALTAAAGYALAAADLVRAVRARRTRPGV
jgi:hypothetical protein